MVLTLNLTTPVAIGCFFIAVMLFQGIGKNLAKRGIRGFVQLWEMKNMVFFSIAWCFIMLGLYLIFPLKIFLLISPVPMIIFMFLSLIKKIVAKRKGNKHVKWKEKQTQEAYLISKELGYE